MKKKLIFLLVIIFLAGLVLAADSPYARRIRPFAAGFPVSCVENEIGYDMTGHVLGICDNSGTYQPLLTSGSGAVFPSQGGNSGKFLSTDGTSTFWATVSSGVTSVFGRTGVVVAASNDYTFAQLASIPTTFSGYGISDTSANLATAITNETGTGLLVFGTSPRLVTSILDTNGNTLLGITATGSAVNSFNIANSAGTASPLLSVIGSATNLDMTFTPKGIGGWRFKSADSTVLFDIRDSANNLFFSIDQANSQAIFRVNPADQDQSGGNWTVLVANGRNIVSPTGSFEWRVAINSAIDTQLTRNSAGVVQVGTTSANSAGWLNYAGSNQCFLQADQTNATTTFANINNCSISVTSGRRYTFKAIFYLSDSISADGAKVNFNGGAATATNFRVHCTAFDSALNLSSQGSALATAYSASTFTGAGMFECHGTFEPSSSSTFIPQFAQNAHTTGTLTLARGSSILMQDVGP